MKNLRSLVYKEFSKKSCHSKTFTVGKIRLKVKVAVVFGEVYTHYFHEDILEKVKNDLSKAAKIEKQLDKQICKYLQCKKLEFVA